VNILLLHQNFPGQYSHVANWAKREKGVKVAAITDSNNKRADFVQTVKYKAPETVDAPIGGAAKRFAEAVSRAEGAAKAAIAYRRAGFTPDLILGHGAWGETFYMREVFPDAKVITYAEFYYQSKGYNIGFDPEFDPEGPEMIRTVDSQNAVMQMALHSAHYGYAPTLFQASAFPAELSSKIGVVFDGIDTAKIAPNPQAQVTLPGGITLKTGDPVITFINRNFEPYRGYHIFMRALPEILARNPKAHVIMIGGDGVSYGGPPPNGAKWRDIFLDEVKDRIDLSRVHFLGRVPHDALIRCYQVSAAHVYLTYPFVLSWSMMEAMSAGCLIIGSDVAPVQEVIEHGKNGLLVPFFDTAALAQQVTDALEKPQDFQHLREAARATIIEKYDLNAICLPSQLALYRRILAGEGLGEFAAQHLLGA
jgi:glycosyltransferase involved in cell wall biosynthesis